MRVALIAPDIPDYSIAFAKAVSTRCDVLLVAPESILRDGDVLSGPTLALHSVHWPRHRSARNALFLTRLFRAIRQFRPDVIHVLSEKNIWLNALPPFFRGTPIVTTVHDVQYHPGDEGWGSVPEWSTHFFIRQSDAIVVHSPRLRRQAIERLPVGERAVHVIPHIELSRYRELATSRNLRPTVGSPPTVLFFGRIRRYKGIELLIAAARRVASEIPQLRFTIAGQSDHETRSLLAKATPSLFDVRDRFVPDLEAAQLFTDAQLLVLPYIEASQSGVLAIACTFGLPVVAADVGDLGATVAEFDVGLVVPPNDPVALAQAIVAMMRDDELRQKFSNNARRMQQDIGPTNIAAKAFQTYRDIMRAYH